jgi:hypothetical protein
MPNVNALKSVFCLKNGTIANLYRQTEGSKRWILCIKSQAPKMFERKSSAITRLGGKSQILWETKTSLPGVWFRANDKSLGLDLVCCVKVLHGQILIAVEEQVVAMSPQTLSPALDTPRIQCG